MDERTATRRPVMFGVCIKGQTTGCSAPSDRNPEMTCGFMAAGPHPDPEIGYRLPLCVAHLESATSASTPTDGNP